MLTKRTSDLERTLALIFEKTEGQCGLFKVMLGSLGTILIGLVSLILLLIMTLWGWGVLLGGRGGCSNL